MKGKLISQIIFCISILSSSVASANLHLISITPINDFPKKVKVNETSTALFSVTNIAWMLVKVTDKSCFPATSGLSISSFNCENAIKPGESCTIELFLKASSIPQIIATELKETVQPSSTITDFVKYPILINIIKSSKNTFTITPSAAKGGGIRPQTPQKVSRGQNQTFTAVPDISYDVDQWLVDDKLAQKSGLHYTLENITADHTVKVTFSKNDGARTIVVIANDKDIPLDTKPILMTSRDKGDTWQIQPLFDSIHVGYLEAVDCSGNSKDGVCIAAGYAKYSEDHYYHPMLVVSKDGGRSWEVKVIKDITDGMFNAMSCTGKGQSLFCTLAGWAEYAALFYMTHDGGESWQSKLVNGSDNSVGVHPENIHCVNDVCLAVGFEEVRGGMSGDELFDATRTWLSTDGGMNWTVDSHGNGIYESASCNGAGNDMICVAGGDAHTPHDYLHEYKLLSSYTKATGWKIEYDGSPEGYVTTVSCAGSGANDFCLAASGDWLSLTRNKGISWDIRKVKNKTAVKCIETNKDPFCILYGHSAGLEVSSDGAKTWQAKLIPDINPSNFDYRSLHGNCVDEGQNIFCMLVGNSPQGSPLIVTSENSGNTWEVKKRNNLTNIYVKAISMTE